MGIIDWVIIAAVLLALALCVRSLAKGGGDCRDCGSAGSCAGHAGGGCSAAQGMLADVEKALAGEKAK